MLENYLAMRLEFSLKRSKLVFMRSGKGSKLHEATGDEPPWPGSSIMLNGASIQVNDSYSRPTARGMRMSQLAGFLQYERSVGRLVVDETNLKGVYPITLDYSDSPGNGDRPDLFTALQEQLGLKLESKKGNVEMIVVDHAEKTPTEN